MQLNAEMETSTNEALALNSDEGGNLTFTAWVTALTRGDVKTHRIPNEGATAFIFARAHSLEHHTTTKLSKVGGLAFFCFLFFAVHVRILTTHSIDH